jgi:hypothetical protein
MLKDSIEVGLFVIVSTGGGDDVIPVELAGYSPSIIREEIVLYLGDITGGGDERRLIPEVLEGEANESGVGIESDLWIDGYNLSGEVSLGEGGTNHHQ